MGEDTSRHAKLTALTPLHEDAGALVVDFAGYRLPMRFAGTKEEHRAVREFAGLFDVSHMGQFLLSGNGALATLQGLVTADLNKLALGRAKYTLLCNEDGGIEDDLIVYRLGDDRFWVVCNGANVAVVAAALRAALHGQALLEDLLPQRSLLAFQGPKADELLRRVLRELPDCRRFAVVDSVFQGTELWAARTGYSGEDGYELSCDAQVAPALWRALLASEEAVQAAGLGARDTLRLEAGLMLHGQDISTRTNPFAAGLGRFVDLEKDSFRGQSALCALRENPGKRLMTGLCMVDRGIARAGYEVYSSGGSDALVGEVTSGGPGLTVGKNIAMAYVDTACATPGGRVEVEIRGKRCAAELCGLPFYHR